MSFWKWIRVRQDERVVLLKDGRPVELLGPGRHLRISWGGGLAIERFSTREPWIQSPILDWIVREAILGDEAIALDLGDRDRAIVKIDGRYAAVLGPGVFALWTVGRKIEVERYALSQEAESIRLEHPALPRLVELPGAKAALDVAVVPAGSTGLVMRDGRIVREMAEVEPGLVGFWRGAGKFQVLNVDRREQSLDVAGQEILTADKVTLRLNALVVFRVTDPVKAVSTAESFGQALYRQAQLALRAVVGARELDAFLVQKDEVVTELKARLASRADEIGLEIREAGIRDVILPGEMKEILNRVVEARKQAEAALLTRREETAAIRMQANTARIFESSPTLLKLKELEVLEKVSQKANLTVVLGDGGLTEKVMKLV